MNRKALSFVRVWAEGMVGGPVNATMASINRGAQCETELRAWSVSQSRHRFGGTYYGGFDSKKASEELGGTTRPVDGA
jgi:hypothetical protein